MRRDFPLSSVTFDSDGFGAQEIALLPNRATERKGVAPDPSFMFLSIKPSHRRSRYLQSGADEENEAPVPQVIDWACGKSRCVSTWNTEMKQSAALGFYCGGHRLGSRQNVTVFRLGWREAFDSWREGERAAMTPMSLVLTETSSLFRSCWTRSTMRLASARLKREGEQMACCCAPVPVHIRMYTCVHVWVRRGGRRAREKRSG